jgi:carbamoyltransferase
MTGAILGLNAFHGDASACIIVDGQIVAAAEEERFRRIKHWAGFPSESIRYCLAEAGLRLADVKHVAVNSDPRASLFSKVAYVLRTRPDPRLLFQRFRNAERRLSTGRLLEAADLGGVFSGQVHRIEHHEAHLASAFYASGWDEALALSVDGFGDFASAAWGVWTVSHNPVQGRVPFPHSLGVFYQAMTQYLGFPSYGDEFKVMGLSGYANGNVDPSVSKLVTRARDGSFRLDLQYFRHHREKIAYQWEDGIPTVGTLFSDALPALLGPVRERDELVQDRHRELAHSTQVVYENSFFALLDALHEQSKVSRVVLAGGCAMNSLANGAITERTGLEEVFVQPAAGDAGGAFGAAAVVHKRLGGAMTGLQMQHAYWGPPADDGAIRAALQDNALRLDEASCTVEHCEDPAVLSEDTASAIASGEVIGWFQGRMEWGPRALGARSILADPRRADMRELLNVKIKLREPFRPFAPAILAEAAGDWFERAAPVPFMMQVLPIRQARQKEIPAVTHVDGTGRVQTVTRDTNPRYYDLIAAFGRITGVPILLNTSFNENEPIVCTPEEAINCFLRTRMDRLVVGDWVVRRDSKTL